MGRRHGDNPLRALSPLTKSGGHQNILFLTDFQVKPGAPQDHFPWIASYTVEKKPDIIIQGGDWNDNHSLNAHNEKGSLPLEGARYIDDIAAVSHSFKTLNDPIEAEITRTAASHKRRWKPRRIFTKGNHEYRADRAASNDPNKLQGIISSDDFKTPGWERYEFLEVIDVCGILFSHYFKMQNSNNPIGGSTDNRLNKIGQSHVGGHTPGMLYGNRTYPNGITRHSLTAGSGYLHQEDYRGPQCNSHFRGIVMLNDVRNGDYDIMPVSLKFLCRKYEGMELDHYMKLKYPNGNWDHLQ